MLGAAASLAWASHAPFGHFAGLGRRHHLSQSGSGGALTLAAFHSLDAGLDPEKMPLAQRYDPLARIAKAGLPDTAHSQAVGAATTTAPPAQTFEDLTPQQAALVNAQIPFSPLPIQAAKPFHMPSGSANDRARALTCLTMAVYYEAASESDAGQAAVAQVVLNRLRHPIFPKSICGVVFQGSSLPTGCQFTFTCDGSLNRKPSQAGWARAQKAAQRALNGFVLKQVGEATHYHTQWVVPYWRPTLVKETQIGAHIFYRWPGGMGLQSDFAGKYAGFEPPPAPIPGFDTGQTTVMIAHGDKPAETAQIAQIDTPAATREAVQAAQATPLAAAPAPLTLAPASPATPAGAAPAAPEKPVYFGKPFRQRRSPAGGV